MYYIRKRLEIAGSHCLDLPYDSKCNELHGHNWIITVYCKSKSTDKNGMVIDFQKIKDFVMQFDHANINKVLKDGSFALTHPTAENLAFVICAGIDNCYKVEVQESEGNVATYELEGGI